MSSRYTKIKYKEEGAYGTEDEYTLYCHENCCCDVTTFYDENGNHLLSIGDTTKDNMLEKMWELYSTIPENNSNIEKVSYLDFKKVLDARQ